MLMNYQKKDRKNIGQKSNFNQIAERMQTKQKKGNTGEPITS